MKIGLLPPFPDWWSLLTPDERRVVQLVTEGLTNREIAEELNVTADVIKDRMLLIFLKANCTSRLELAVLAMRARD